MVVQVLLCLAGFVLLYYGAEWLVKGSSSLAKGMGISPIVIGLTVVAFGTSAPELVVSLVSAIKGKTMIAVGNVIGSNICNIALVLGLAAVFQPITCDRSVVRRDIPIMIVISACLILLIQDSYLSRVEGAVLVGGIILYTAMNYSFARKSVASGPSPPAAAAVSVPAIESRGVQLLLILVGIAGVVGGAKLAVDAAEQIMTALGVSEKFIGLTVVAFGTSLPELATSVVAALRKEMDISIGNLVGSNVFNLLSVLGAASLVSPISIQEHGLGFFQSGMIIDYCVMIVTSSIPLFLMVRTPIVTRRGGILLLACYGGYFAYLVLTAKTHG